MPWLFREAKEPKAAPPSDMAPRGQFVTTKFPVLTEGLPQRIDLATWRFEVYGLVERELQWEWEEFRGFPTTVVTADFHCVTQWSRLENV